MQEKGEKKEQTKSTKLVGYQFKEKTHKIPKHPFIGSKTTVKK
jgi:hypothetical protein